MQINVTQAAGLLAFLPAVVVGVAASRRTGGRTGIWSSLAAINALMAAEIMLMLRHDVSGSVGAWLCHAGLYADRRSSQAAMILALLLLALLALPAVLRKATTKPQAVAIGSTFAAVLLFMVESVSLHAIDAVLYQPVGPMLLIGWLWLASGWSTVAAGLSSLGRSRTRTRG